VGKNSDSSCEGKAHSDEFAKGFPMSSSDEISKRKESLNVKGLGGYSEVLVLNGGMPAEGRWGRWLESPIKW